MMRRLLSFLRRISAFSPLAVLFSARAWAEDELARPGGLQFGKEAARSAPDTMNTSAQLLSILLALMLVVGLILALAWIVRRIGPGGLLSRGDMRIVASMAMGTRERLVVVDVAGQQMLLGVTPTQINCLHVFDEPVIQPGESGNRATPAFREKLLEAMGRRPGGERQQ